MFLVGKPIFLMIDFLQAVILGVLQGITEWLPISSSGHLVVAQQAFGLQVPVLFDVVLHLGTLLVVFLVFYRDIWGILKALGRGDFKSPEGRLFLFIVAGSIPTAIIGFAFHNVLISFFTNLMVVGTALLATGCVLIATRWASPARGMDYKRSVLVGIAQGIAIIPGMSRSGLTIGSGLLAGVKREAAVRFSFLLSIPAVLGALAFEAGDLALTAGYAFPMAAGFIVSVLVGYVFLRLLIRLVMQKRFHWFAVYCWAAGAVILALV